MRIFVTGARGFVGSVLLPRLVEAGHEVTGADREVDVTDVDSLSRVLGRIRPEAIVHLAAQSSVATSLSEPDLSWRINFLGTHALLRATSAEAPSARLLLIGSADQYTPTEPGAAPLRESAPQTPRNPYARSKAAAEQLGQRARADGMDVVCVRAFNHTGPGQTTRFVAPDFAHQIAEIATGRRPPRMRVGNLDTVRDFLDVRDVVDAYTALLDPRIPADVYNVASGEGRTIRSLLEVLCRHGGVDPAIETDPARHRPTDWLIGDAARLRDATGWRPRHAFDETLGRLLSDSLSRLEN